MRNLVVILMLCIMAQYNGTIEQYRSSIHNKEEIIKPVLGNAYSLIRLAASLDGSLDYDLMTIDNIQVVDSSELYYKVDYRSTRQDEVEVARFLARFSSLEELLNELDSYQYNAHCYTPYEAIYASEYNCQSASMLIQKLADRLGLASRILIGEYDGMPHGLVRIGNRYMDYTLYREGITKLYENELGVKYNVQEIGGLENE